MKNIWVFHFLKRKTATLVSVCLLTQAQQTHLYQADSHMRDANAKVYHRVSLRENIKISNTQHSKYCLEELLNDEVFVS